MRSLIFTVKSGSIEIKNLTSSSYRIKECNMRRCIHPTVSNDAKTRNVYIQSKALLQAVQYNPNQMCENFNNDNFDTSI